MRVCTFPGEFNVHNILNTKIQYKTIEDPYYVLNL